MTLYDGKYAKSVHIGIWNEIDLQRAIRHLNYKVTVYATLGILYCYCLVSN